MLAHRIAEKCMFFFGDWALGVAVLSSLLFAAIYIIIMHTTRVFYTDCRVQ